MKTITIKLVVSDDEAEEMKKETFPQFQEKDGFLFSSVTVDEPTLLEKVNYNIHVNHLKNGPFGTALDHKGPFGEEGMFEAQRPTNA